MIKFAQLQASISRQNFYVVNSRSNVITYKVRIVTVYYHVVPTRF